jgi:L-threonylcarbamoyladenylate synthase
MTPEPLQPTPENVQRVAECIRDGGVVAAPSDTNVALTLDPWHAEAVDRAYEIKSRPPEKPLTLFVRDPDEWRRFGHHSDPDAVTALTEAFWPGPLNIVLEATEYVHDDRLTMDGTVSIGCLSNPVWRDLTSHLDGPVAMTSANVSGTVADDELVTVDTALDHVGDAVDHVLAGEPQSTTRASTILDLTGDGPEIIRRGDITREEIDAALGDASDA